MEDILELFTQFSAVWIYGTEENPRAPFWRNSVRIIAFSGVFVSTAGFLGLLGSFEFPLIVTLIWALCSVIVFSAEYYLGSKKLWWAALIAYPIWLTIAIVTEIS
ncbi:MAG: hypothetical protein ABJH45_12710 [Paracoccaceae bacterium]